MTRSYGDLAGRLEDAPVVPVEYQVLDETGEWSNWRKAGCDGWRADQAAKNFIADRIAGLRVIYNDGSMIEYLDESRSALKDRTGGED